MELTKKELSRYDRQIRIPEFGEVSQKKLKSSSVLLIGCGGLGSPALLYLAAAGIGKIGLVENDKVESSNLQRQVVYEEKDLGEEKIERSAEKIRALNENIIIEKFPTRLSSKNALEILSDYDIIIDGSDNFPTRYLVNDACVLLDKPFVSGAIYRFEGQVSVFNFENGPNYRDLFPAPPSEEMAPNCATAGVLGVVAGLVGTIQATEAIKVLTGIGQPLTGKMLLIDTLSMNFRKIKIFKNGSVKPITELIDYEAFCSNNAIQNIKYQDFLNLTPPFQLIDVREPDEFENQNIGGELMPLSEIEKHIPKIRKDCKVILHCHSGMRSKKAITLLQEQFGFTNLFSLEGGILAAHP